MPGSPSVPRTVAVLAALLALLSGCSTQISGTPSAAPGGPPAGPSPSVAPPPAPDPDPVGGFEDPQARFGLVPPPGWETDTSGTPGAAAVFLDPQPVDTPAGPFRPNINVQVGPSPGDLDVLLDQSRVELATLTGYTPTADEPATLDDGTPAHLIGGTFTDDATGLELQNLQLFAIDAGDDVVVVTATAPRAAWDDYADRFDASVRTLTVRG